MANRATFLNISCLFIGLVVIFSCILGIVAIILQLEKAYNTVPHYCIVEHPITCTNGSYQIVETIPYGDFNDTLYSPFESTSDAWIDMITGATTSIQIACSYFSLNQSMYTLY